MGTSLLAGTELCVGVLACGCLHVAGLLRVCQLINTDRLAYSRQRSKCMQAGECMDSGLVSVQAVLLPMRRSLSEGVPSIVRVTQHQRSYIVSEPQTTNDERSSLHDFFCWS